MKSYFIAYKILSMPVFYMKTNITVPSNFIQKASKETALLTKKDESRVLVNVDDNCKLTFGGTSEPAAMISFRSIGLKQEDYPAVSKAIGNLISDIGISPDRCYIDFISPLPTNIGKSYTTVYELMRQ